MTHADLTQHLASQDVYTAIRESLGAGLDGVPYTLTAKEIRLVLESLPQVARPVKLFLYRAQTRTSFEARAARLGKFADGVPVRVRVELRFSELAEFGHRVADSGHADDIRFSTSPKSTSAMSLIQVSSAEALSRLIVLCAPRYTGLAFVAQALLRELGYVWVPELVLLQSFGAATAALVPVGQVVVSDTIGANPLTYALEGNMRTEALQVFRNWSAGTIHRHTFWRVTGDPGEEKAAEITVPNQVDWAGFSP
jgi:hypothetical protein